MSTYTYDQLMLNGRLGNQLWQIAATIYAAEKNGGIARFNPSWEYRKFFSIPDEYFDLCSDDDHLIDGGTEYFQELKYFEPISEKIKQYFAPSEDAKKQLNAFGDFVKNNRPVCAMHVRRGDYLKHGTAFFPIMSTEYFTAAVEDVKSRLEDPVFMVFSDDPEWCRQNVDYLGFRIGDRVGIVDGVVRPVEVDERVGDPEDWFDLFSISKCQEHIISNSTFSWWGAYLSDNTSVIYPSKWFGKRVPNWQNWENAIPSTWRKFEC